jgi:hypothetical protein
MSERPIIFSGPMVRAILEGRKTQTRRLRGKYEVGDVLWVRETWGDHSSSDGHSKIVYRADFATAVFVCWRWKSPLHLRRADSRIDLEVVSVRRERLQDTSEADARAEGCVDRAAFECIWNGLNAKRSPWGDNPEVVVVEFKVIKPVGRKYPLAV